MRTFSTIVMLSMFLVVGCTLKVTPAKMEDGEEKKKFSAEAKMFNVFDFGVKDKGIYLKRDF